MANQFTAVCNLTKDPEELTLGERELVKLRVADNTFGKNALPRYFDALVGGPDVDAARQLKTGDQVVLTGQLVKSSYKSKSGKTKGKTVETDSMPFAKLMQITRSPSFFGADDAEGGGDEPEAGDPGTDDAVAGDSGAGDDPMADLV